MNCDLALALVWTLASGCSSESVTTPPGADAVADSSTDGKPGDTRAESSPVDSTSPTDTATPADTEPPADTFKPKPDSGPTPSGTIACGGAYCSAATEVCCGTKPAGTVSCVKKGGCSDIALECSSKASCSGGLVCCATATGSTCATSCPSGLPALCETDAECNAGETCTPTTFDVNVCT